MNCQTFKNNIVFYSENSLPKEKTEEFQTHLKVCNSCQKIYNEVEQTLNVFEDEKKLEINPFFYTRLQQKIDNRASQQEMPIYLPIFKKILKPVFVGVIIVFGIFIGINFGKRLDTFASAKTDKIENLQTLAQELSLTEEQQIENYIHY
ncbi:MAG: hypothetical protein HN704_02185 [Bacteroidetes bacterium]|jgi:hypothetical protein|nr:hypothetical protein [Bacteroidota bacterium]MBT6687335.1 hypothetical protein [Bacteroidota bacterium]MBT7144631.1 hypothetical protein [Bacteroidota bacterium]MBT7490395.1 hypothetical protein [Bacteroidota bacterium]